MLWLLRSTRSGRTFSPFDVGIWDETAWWKHHAPVEPVHSSVDLEPLIQAAVALENDHSLENDLNDLDDVESMPSAEPLPQASPINDRKHPLPPNTDATDCNSYRHAKRRKARYEQSLSNGQCPSERTRNLMKEMAVPIHTSLQMEGLSAAKGAYSATVRKEADAKAVHSIEELVGNHGFRLVEWGDGRPRPIVDAKNCVVAIIAGQPSDPSYTCSCMEAFDVMAAEENAARFRKRQEHRRGAFPAVNVGISYGKGQRVPSRLQNGTLASMVHRLVGHTAVIRMAVYASASLNLWAPHLYLHYKDHLDQLYKKLPHLKPNFEKSIFPCATFNFGSNIWTFKHRDLMNCLYGLCAITALGRFDPKKGGHIVLWELKLIVEFPHACTIMIPSATITHSNIPVAEGDSRSSFTQFLAGELLRWVDNGFRTEKEMAKEDPTAFAALKEFKAG